MLFELPTGGLADAIGRKPVLVMAGILFAALDIFLLIGHTLPVFVLAAFLGGAGRALSSGPLESWYVDRVRSVDPVRVLREDFSTAGILEGAALTFGALASVGLANLPTGVVFGLSNTLVPVFGAVVADLVFVGFALATIHETRRVRTTTRAVVADVPKVVADGLRLAGSRPMIRRLLGTTLAVAIAAVSIETLWQPRYADFLGGADEAAKVAGLVVAGFALASVVGSWGARHLPARLVDRSGTAASLALVASASGLVGMALTDSVWPLSAALLVVYGFLAVSHVLRQELLHEWVSGERRTTIVSVDSLAGQLGNVGASLILVPIAGATSIPTGWMLGALVLMIGAGLVASARMPTNIEREGIGTITIGAPAGAD